MKVVASHAAGINERIKGKDEESVSPRSATVRTAGAEGKLVKTSLTQEQPIAHGKHEPEEQGRNFDPATITRPVGTYQIQCDGGVINF